MAEDKDTKDNKASVPMSGAATIETDDKTPVTSPTVMTPAVEPDRNIIFVGAGEPAEEIFGALKIKLPKAEIQKTGFYHERARELIVQFPKKYKKFVKKGE